MQREFFWTIYPLNQIPELDLQTFLFEILQINSSGADYEPGPLPGLIQLSNKEFQQTWPT